MLAGFGAAEITPELGMRTGCRLGLYVDRIVTPLLIKVCLMVHADVKTAVVAVDTTTLFATAIAGIRAVVSAVAGVPPPHIGINASHTHSAPYLHVDVQQYLNRFHAAFLDDAYYELVLRAASQAAQQALDNLAPASLEYSTGTVAEVAANRRIRTADGTVRTRYGRDVPRTLRNFPDGLIDPHVHCLWFTDNRRRTLGSMINYACHATAYNQYSHSCWDYPGFAVRHLEETTGGHAMFLQGCAGNIGSGKYAAGEPLQDAGRMGSRLAEAALHSRAFARPVAFDAIAPGTIQVPLDIRIDRTIGELESQLAEALARGADSHAQATVISLAERIHLLSQTDRRQMNTEITLWKLGSLHLLFFPGECFVQLALALKDAFPDKQFLIMAYADTTLQYIPDDAAYDDRGDYETGEEWCFARRGSLETLYRAAARQVEA